MRIEEMKNVDIRTVDPECFTRCWKGVDMLQTAAKRKYSYACQTSV